MNVQNYKIEEANTNDIVILRKLKSIVTNVLQYVGNKKGFA